MAITSTTPFGKYYAPLQELLDFAIMEIPDESLTQEMLEAVTWFNAWDRSAERLQSLL